jgi:ABC-type bacteriocin/lantibiotic exporter with double-glycine peptidase domain
MKQLLLVFLAVLLSASHKCLGTAEPNAISHIPKIQKKSSGGYCGIYCLYAAMKYFGVNADPNELIKPEYIGSVKGSSLAELKKAAEKHGLYAVAVDRMTTKDLRGLVCQGRLSLPLIIHVKSSPTDQKYDHYLLFLGLRQGQALIYDPPGSIESVEFWTLAPRWDGSGLLISDKPINMNAVFASSRLRFSGYAVIAVVIVLIIRLALARFYSLKKVMSRKKTVAISLAQCAVLVLAASSVAFLYNFINDEGLFKRPQATKAIQLAYHRGQKAGVPK